MENASKALLMAGGMIFAILIVSLLLYAWSLFSKYQSSQDSLADIEDTAKFNEQFTNYDRNGVQGYEILSLVNKVIDYNYRKSSATGAKSNENYKPMTLTINLSDDNTRRKLTKDNTIRLFTKSKYVQSDTSNTFADIIGATSSSGIKQIEDLYGGSDAATKIAKGIDSIFLSTAQINQNRNNGMSETDSWNKAIQKFNSYSTNLKINSKDELNGQKENVYKYYEYVQFKRAKFNSVASSIKYDDTSGRICQMEFTFTGELY